MGEREEGRTRPEGAESPPESPGEARRSLRFGKGPPGFEADVAVYLRDRLRIVTGFMGIAGAVLLVLGRVNDVVNHGWEGSDFLHPSVLVHAGACVVALALHGFLRWRTPSPRGLAAVDAIVVAAVAATCLLIYAFSYRIGARQLVALLPLFLIARAVVVPSTAARTLWLSAPPVAGVLLIQMHHGTIFVAEGLEVPAGRFVSWVVWDQAVLWLAVAVAALTSRVNFALRLRAWEAGEVERYAVEGLLGSGSMGEVYRARHGLLRRPTALKVLRPELAGEDNLRRFEEEVRQTARLTHPNTIAVYDYGTTADGVFYYAMELLEGGDLQRIVDVAGPMPAARVVHVLAQVCGALEEAHGIGLIHRDIKPANIMLCRRGGVEDVAKVMDFGLVRDMTPGASRGGEAGSRSSGLSGTPLTMAPETLRGALPAPAADLYAVGAVGCWLLTGRPPFDAGTVGEFLQAHLNDPPVPPSSRVDSVPADLEAVLLRCLLKDPDRRWTSAGDLRAALEGCRDAGAWTRREASGWWERWGPALGNGATAGK